MLQDLRVAVRMLRRSPLFTAVATLALGVGIGANTAVFSLLDALLLRPAAGIERPEEMVSFERWQSGQLMGTMSFPDYQDYRTQLRGFSGLIAEAGLASLSVATPSVAERVTGALVSGNYFAVLGARPALGRLLEESDGQQGAAVVVLGNAYWQRAFGASRQVTGTIIRLNGRDFTVVGVAESDFRGARSPSAPDVWLPIEMQPVAMPHMTAHTLENRASGWLRIFGRLKPGNKLAAAQAEVNTVAVRLGQAYPLTNHSRTVTLVPGLGLFSDDRTALRRFLSLLLVCMGLLQLIACANVANLMLARATARAREVAVRLAMGATRMRLMRMFLTEGVVLALLAGGLGLLLAPSFAELAVSVPQPTYAMRNAQVRLDPMVLGFSMTVTLLSALLFASAPAWRATRTDLVTPLKEGVRGSGRSRLRGVLIAAQVALSLGLLAGAASGIGALRRALAVNPVARPQEVLLCSMDLNIQGYSREQADLFFTNLLARVREMPTVSAVSLSSTVPPEEYTGRRAIFYPGQEPPPEVLQGRELELGVWVDSTTVAPGFFQTLGMPVVRGRDFTAQDRRDTPLVAIINERLAARLWPAQDPVGKRVAVPVWGGPPRPAAEVIGVVKDGTARSLLAEVTPQLYLAQAQEGGGRAYLVVRGSGSHAELAANLRRTVAQLDPTLPLYAFQSMPDHIAAGLWRQRIAAGVLGAFGLLAVAMASLGLYGVVAFSVTQRTREIGIRLALGAQRRQISRLVIRDGMLWVAVGSLAGLPVAIFAASAMQRAVPGTGSLDSPALAATFAILGAAGLLASALPARRASRLDPVVALRYE